MVPVGERETIVGHGRLDESGFSVINPESALAKEDHAGTFVWSHPNETYEDNSLNGFDDYATVSGTVGQVDDKTPSCIDNEYCLSLIK